MPEIAACSHHTLETTRRRQSSEATLLVAAVPMPVAKVAVLAANWAGDATAAYLITLGSSDLAVGFVYNNEENTSNHKDTRPVPFRYG